MKRIKRMVSLFLVLCLVFTPIIPMSAQENLSLENKDLTGYTIILHTNDSHGRAVPDSYSGYMGFTAVSALKKQYEAAGAQVILMDAGDTLHGLPIATLEKGESIIKLMNLAGYDVMTPGNHDFNYGTQRLIELKEKMEFPLISANVAKKNSNELLLQDSLIIEKNGVKYGIFGLATPETAYKTNPNNVSTVEFTNPVEAAKKEVTKLKSEGAQVIVSLAHLGLDESSEYTSKLVAEEVDGIDLIVDGHSHTILEAGLQVEDTLIVSTGEYIQNIGVVTIDKEGKMLASLVNGALFTKTDKEIDDVVSEITTGQETLLSEVVGKTSVYLDGVRDNVRTRETNLGNLATDAFRDATGADVAMTNGGGIRASIEIGDITKKDLVTVFPFGNYIVTKNVSGKALLEALEVGVASYPESLGAFPQVSGVTFQVDVLKPAGSRVVNAKINGENLDPNKTYLLATNDFMVAGGDGYTMFTDFDIVNEYGAMEEIIINYINKLETVSVKTQERITVINELPVVEEEEEIQEPVKDIEPNTEIESKTDTETDNKNRNETETETKTESESITNSIKEETVKNENQDLIKEYQVYVVVKGDYLRKIAKKFYGSENEWKIIYELNKDVISNPDKIYIGQKLRINVK